MNEKKYAEIRAYFSLSCSILLHPYILFSDEGNP